MTLLLFARRASCSEKQQPSYVIRFEPHRAFLYNIRVRAQVLRLYSSQGRLLCEYLIGGINGYFFSDDL